MKNSVVKRLMQDGYSKTIAEALADKYWEEAERHGCGAARKIYEFIIKTWRTA